jgi:hypothetical protein
MLFSALSPFNKHIVGRNVITPAWILDSVASAQLSFFLAYLLQRMQ